MDQILLKKVTRLLIAVNVVLLIAAIGVVVFSILKGEEGGSSFIKLKTEDFSLALHDMYGKISDISEDIQPSPGKQNDPKEYKTEYPSLEFLSLPKPVAVFSFQGLNKQETGKFPLTKVRNWMTSALYNGMEYENGSLTVPVSGIYHLYSRIGFYIDGNTTGPLKMNISHLLVRFNIVDMEEDIACYDVTELSVSGNGDGQRFDYPSNVHCLVYLNAADQVFVNISKPMFMKIDENLSNFGANII